MKRAAAFLLLLTVLVSLTACALKAAPETTEAASGAQGPGTAEK